MRLNTRQRQHWEGAWAPDRGAVLSTGAATGSRHPRQPLPSHYPHAE